MGFGTPKKPMRFFHAVSKAKFFSAKKEAEQGKTLRQRLRDVHEGELIRGATEGRVKAYSGSQAVRFMAILEIRRERVASGRMRMVNPYEGTPLDIGPRVLVEERDAEPAEDEIRTRSRKLRSQYWMIDEDDWQEAVTMSMVAVEAIAAKSVRKREKKDPEKKTKRTRINGRRVRIEDMTDEEVIELVAEEERRAYREPVLPVRPEEQGCGCIYYLGLPKTMPMELGKRRPRRSRAKPLPPPRIGPKPEQLSLFSNPAP